MEDEMQYPLQRLEEGVIAKVYRTEEEAMGRRGSKKLWTEEIAKGYTILFSHL